MRAKTVPTRVIRFQSEVVEVMMFLRRFGKHILVPCGQRKERKSTTQISLAESRWIHEKKKKKKKKKKREKHPERDENPPPREEEEEEERI